MRVLMLVATSVVTDTRVLREAGALAAAGHPVHVVGRQVPDGFDPPPGVTVSSVGAGSVFRSEGTPSLGSSRAPLSPLVRLGRWALLPQHRNQVFARWAAGVYREARDRAFDVVHAHDFTALGVGHRLAREHGVPLVYDSHELWSGRSKVGRPTPVQTLRERRTEQRLGADAAAVLTVGSGIAEALRGDYGWRDVHVVRNTFPIPALPAEDPVPTALVYAGRLAPHRELEVIATASADLPLPVHLVGPADETWLAAFDPGTAKVEPALPVDDVAALLRAAGVALVTGSDRFRSYRLAMPNKLFHAISAGVPTVATDVGVLAETVREHGVGTLYRPGDPASLRRAVQDLLDGYAGFVAAVRRAAQALSWSADERVLLDVYAGLQREPASRT